MKAPILKVRDLAVEFATYGGHVKAVRGVSFDVFPGEILSIVGESGCGKSVTLQTLMGLIPCPPGRVTSGSAVLGDRDLLKMTRQETFFASTAQVAFAERQHLFLKRDSRVQASVQIHFFFLKN